MGNADRIIDKQTLGSFLCPAKVMWIFTDLLKKDGQSGFLFDF